MPEWLRSKCMPLGVMIPSSRCSGVRAVPTPGSGGLGGERMARSTLSSKREGWPYPVKPEPGSFIQLSTVSGSANALDTPARAAPVTSAPSRKMRRLRIPLPDARSPKDAARRKRNRALVIGNLRYTRSGKLDTGHDNDAVLLRSARKGNRARSSFPQYLSNALCWHEPFISMFDAPIGFSMPVPSARCCAKQPPIATGSARGLAKSGSSVRLGSTASCEPGLLATA